MAAKRASSWRLASAARANACDITRWRRARRTAARCARPR
jgi:hypothetical protein